MRRPQVILLSLAFLATAAIAQEPRHADHEELRAMLRTATTALSTHNFDLLAPMLTSDCVITSVDGKSFRGPAAFKSYLDQLYGTKIKSIVFRPTADALTTFYGDDMGVCAGSSNDIYTFTDGDTRTMQSRWTATLHKENGHWKLAALHMSASILDNPVVDTVKSRAKIYVIAAAVIGIIVGFIIRMLLK